MAVGEVATAALVAPRVPYAANQALSTSYAAVLVDVGIVGTRWKTEALDVAARLPDRQKRPRRVQDLGEEVRGQGQRAQVLEHDGDGLESIDGLRRDLVSAHRNIAVSVDFGG